ncbi:MAG: HEAT repeat domain-containing protein, partial [Nitrospinae bacterium]|nr:HEAT repeat domain-containing protein [Nitrospinota bacterium]
KLPGLFAVLFEKEHLNYFVEILSSSSSNIRQAAREVIINNAQKIEATELVSYLKENTFYARKNIADIIIIKDDPKVVPAVAKLYKETNDEALKKNLLPILKAFPAPTTKELLMSIIEKGSYWERSAAVELLKSYNDPQVITLLEKLLDDKDIPTLKNAVDSLGMMKANSSAIKMVKLIEHDDLILRQKAVEALQKLTNPVIIPELIKMMKSTNVNTRRAIVELLNSIKDEESIKALIHSLEDDDWWVREIATDALTQSQDQMIPEMLQKLLHVKNVAVRQCAVTFFSKIRAPYVLKDLIVLLDDPEWMIREKSVAALSMINDERAIPYILKKASDNYIKHSLPTYLLLFDKEPAIKGLLKLLEIGDNDVVLSCLKVINRKVITEAIPILKKIGANAQFEVQDQINNTIRILSGDKDINTYQQGWRD